MSTQLTRMAIQPVTRAVTHQIAYASLPVWAMAQASALTLPVVTVPTLCPLAAQSLSVKASHALQMPLAQCNVKEQCGRVCLVGFVERCHDVDPELPFALFDLGQRYDRAFRRYAQAVARSARFEPRDWWKRAKRLCDKCLAELERVAGRATVAELVYLVLKLQMPLAWPTGYGEQGYA